MINAGKLYEELIADDLPVVGVSGQAPQPDETFAGVRQMPGIDVLRQGRGHKRAMILRNLFDC